MTPQNARVWRVSECIRVLPLGFKVSLIIFAYNSNCDKTVQCGANGDDEGDDVTAPAGWAIYNSCKQKRSQSDPYHRTLTGPFTVVGVHALFSDMYQAITQGHEFASGQLGSFGTSSHIRSSLARLALVFALNPS